MTLVAVISLLLFNYASAQLPLLGKCPSPAVQENFDMKKFEGMWYEIQRTVSFLQLGSQCTSANISDSGYEDGSYQFVNEGRSPLIKIKKSARLILTVPDEKEPAKMVLRLADLSLHGQYWVLATDYDNYAIAWSCNHVWLTLKYARTENLWVYSRHRQFTKEIQEEVSKKLKEIQHVRVKNLLRRVPQNHCDDDSSTEDNEVE
nr:venom protein [Lampona murina]